MLFLEAQDCSFSALRGKLGQNTTEMCQRQGIWAITSVMANEICLSRQRLVDVSGPLFKSHWQRFQPDTGLAEWAGLRWLKCPPNSAPSVFHQSPHTAPGSGTSGGIKDMQVLQVSVSSPGEQDWPTCQVLWKSARYKLKSVNTLKQQRANMFGIPHPLHEIIISIKKAQTGFCQFLHKLHEHLCKAQLPTKKLLFTTKPTFIFLNNWTVHQ